MISALCWVRKGFANPHLDIHEPSEREMAALREAAGLEEDGDQDNEIMQSEDEEGPSNGNDPASARKNAMRAVSAMQETDEDAAVIAEYGLDDYDNEPDGLEDVLSQGLSQFQNNDDDPYMQGGQDTDSEDEDEIALRPDDILLVSANTEDDVCSLEVNVYDEKQQALFVHHDIIIGGFPLAMSWTNAALGGLTGANFVAVGGMEPAINIWCLDIKDQMEAAVTLGGVMEAASSEQAGAGKSGSKKKGKKNKKQKAATSFMPGSHTDSVLGVCFHPSHATVLASASADGSVKVWDVTQAACVSTLQHHGGKASNAEWHPTEESVLLTASFDGTAAVADARSGEVGLSFKPASGDIECAQWCVTDPNLFAVSTEAGVVCIYDVRKSKSAVHKWDAHEGSTSGLCWSAGVPGLLVTGSEDKLMKVWDVQGNQQPELVTQRKMKIGQILCAASLADSPFTVAAGGSKGSLAVWDLTEDDNVRKVFGGRVTGDAAKAVQAGELQQLRGGEEDVGEGSKQQKTKSKKKSSKK